MHYLMDASVIENPTTPAALNHLSAMRFMIESGAEFRPDDYSDPVYYVVSTVMKGCHRDVFIDDFNEYAVEVFSRDPESDPTTLGVLLSDMACGQFTQVLDLYLEGRPHLSKTMAAADPDYLFEPMIQEIASLFEHSIYDLREILRRSFMVCGSTLNISTANKILSSLSGYSPELVGFLDEYFSEKPSFDDSSSSTYLDDLIISGNQETLDILEKICVDTKMVRYKWFNTYLFNYDRAPLAEYPVWKKYVDDGVDQEVMDMLLTFGKFRSAEEMLTILDLGPDVNSIHTGNQNQRWTPLSGAVFYRDTDTVELLLDKGADVLLDWKGLEWQQGPISVLAAERGNHGLAEMLEKLEVEERASRGIPNPPPRGLSNRLLHALLRFANRLFKRSTARSG